jgi:hypothetical protein
MADHVPIGQDYTISMSNDPNVATNSGGTFSGFVETETFQMELTATNTPVILTSSLITCPAGMGYVIATSTDPSAVANNSGTFNQIFCQSGNFPFLFHNVATLSNSSG